MNDSQTKTDQKNTIWIDFESSNKMLTLDPVVFVNVALLLLVCFICL